MAASGRDAEVATFEATWQAEALPRSPGLGASFGVEALDLCAFYGSYRADGHGAAAHDPRMMVALTLYA